eukprot:TRINITY_DN2890_c2_g1_i1.p1 TRINITY_DN2890_c2_g1~~TRINITY_DN2890_c2_g1_i1.p1  ORF type:complete len:211 (-),score=37.63 TRINITY_DN2890_c2_g1_i1:31-603(-)
MAPEIDRRCGYSKPADMYSVGVIIYILLCGYPPFDFDQGIYELGFGSPEWDEISSKAKDLIRNLLQDDPPKRYTAADLANHPWVSGRDAPQRTLTNNIHATIKNYMALTKMNNKVAGERGHNRRMSIYGLFNIARAQAPPLCSSPLPPSSSLPPIPGTPNARTTILPTSNENQDVMKENPEAELIKVLTN